MRKNSEIIAPPLVLCFALCAMLFALCGPAHAQQTKLPKIGWLAVRPASAVSAFKSFQREFNKLGYVEGNNVAFEYRYAEGKLDRLPALADDRASSTDSRPWPMTWCVLKLT
jgi:hypothetical protein